MIFVSAPPVADGAEARVLMLHHLRLASTYFEATDLDVSIPDGEWSAPAVRAWLTAMEGLYPEEQS